MVKVSQPISHQGQSRCLLDFAGMAKHFAAKSANQPWSSILENTLDTSSSSVDNQLLKMTHSRIQTILFEQKRWLQLTAYIYKDVHNMYVYNIYIKVSDYIEYAFFSTPKALREKNKYFRILGIEMFRVEFWSAQTRGKANTIGIMICPYRI